MSYQVPMRLIGLAVVLALSVTLAPLAAETQQAGKPRRIGVLTASRRWRSIVGNRCLVASSTVSACRRVASAGLGSCAGLRRRRASWSTYASPEECATRQIHRGHDASGVNPRGAVQAAGA